MTSIFCKSIVAWNKTKAITAFKGTANTYRLRQHYLI